MLRRFLLSLALASGSLATTGTAFAAPTVVPGTICASINYAARMTGDDKTPVFLCRPRMVRLTAGDWTQLVVRGPDRVWLHEYYPGRGWALCFTSQHGWDEVYDLATVGFDAGDFQYTSNRAMCPWEPITI